MATFESIIVICIGLYGSIIDSKVGQGMRVPWIGGSASSTTLQIRLPARSHETGLNLVVFASDRIQIAFERDPDFLPEKKSEPVQFPGK